MVDWITKIKGNYVLYLFLAFSAFIIYESSFLLSEWDFYLYHTITELLSVHGYLVVFMITIISWRYLKNYSFIAVVGISLLPVAVFDIIHALSFENSQYFTGYTQNLTLTMWLAARLIQSSSLLIGSILGYKKVAVKLPVIILIYLSISIITVYLVLTKGFIPDLFSTEAGLTNLKIYTEYLISILAIGSLISILLVRRKEFKGNINYFVIFIVLYILSELSFTTYSSFSDNAVVMGHYLKLISTIFLVYFMVNISLAIPNMTLFNKLNTSEKKLKKIAYTDSVTGLGNRAKFEQDSKTSNRKRSFSSIIIGDVDGLKNINDSYGYQTGTDLLKEVANILKESIGENDKVYKFFGGEFIITTPEEGQSLEVLFASLQKDIQNIKYGDESLSFTMGYSSLKKSNEKTISLLKRAEQVLLRNKSFVVNSRSAEALTILMNSLFARSKSTQEHSIRVSRLLVAFSKVLGFDHAEVRLMEQIGILHDIGKIGIPDEILFKSDSLTDIEYEVIKDHSQVGYRILRSIRSLSGIDVAILHHHERWDGLGYPNGVKKDNIPLYSRMLSICDSVDAMYSVRTYKQSKSIKDIKEELQKESGKQFDPDLSIEFLENFESIISVIKESR